MILVDIDSTIQGIYSNERLNLNFLEHLKIIVQRSILHKKKRA